MVPAPAVARIAAGAVVAASALVLPGAAAAQEAPVPSPDGPPPEVTLPGVQVVATGSEEPASRAPRSVTVVGRDSLEDRQARSVPEALLEQVGVFVQKTAHGQGAPILRGLIGKQTLLVVDRTRLNNSIFRTGPNQYLATVDVEGVERIEIVRGPSSVLHGSDALGGVVRVVPRRRDFSEDGTTSFGGRISVRMASAERAARWRGEVTGATPDLGILAGVTAARSGDLVGGRGVGRQHFTGYDEGDADAALAVRLSPTQRLDLLVQEVRQEGIHRPQFLVTGWRGTGSTRNEVWRIDAQDRDLGQLTWSATPGGALEGLSATVSLHRQEEERTERRKGSVQRDDFRDEVETPGAALRAVVRPHAAHRVSVGVEAYRDRVTSDRVRTDLSTGVAVEAPRGTFAGRARYLSLGAYAQDEWDATDRLRVVGGVRASRFRIAATDVDTDLADATALPAMRESFSDLTGSLHLRGDLGRGLSAYGGVSRGFRAPNVEDFTVFSVTSTSFDVPARDLDPERLVQWEAGVRHEGDGLDAGVAYYRSRISGLIDRVPTTWNGATTDGSGRRFTTRENVGTAAIHGLEAEARADLGGGFSASGVLTWTVGTNRDTDEPLSKIPPHFGAAAVRYAPGGGAGWWIEGVLQAARHQRRLSPDDRADTRIPAGGTPGWTTVGLRLGAELTDNLSAHLALENILHRAYRLHGSGVNGAGRGVVLTLTARF